MSNIEQRVMEAKQDNGVLEQLISDYLPFVRKQLSMMGTFGLEYEDAMSVSLLVFVNSVRQYQKDRGGFLSLLSVSMRNRLIDESRKQKRCCGNPILSLTDEGARKGDDWQEEQIASDTAAIAAYSREQERQSLADEIEELSIKLREFGIHFRELPDICPKQERSRKSCFELAREIAQSRELAVSLIQSHQLPQKELAKRFGLSVKTVEKHRKYIVTAAMLLMGDYPGLRTFLPIYGEVR